MTSKVSSNDACVLRQAHDLDTPPAKRVEDARARRGRIGCDDGQPGRAEGAHGKQAVDRRQELGIDRVRRCRGAARLHRTRCGAGSPADRTRASSPSAIECHDIAPLGLGDVLGRDDEGHAGIAPPVQLLPDGAPQDRVDAGRRLVEESDLRIVHERAGELEASLHAA